MSRKNYEISAIGERVVELSSLFSTNKEFLEKCEISNLSFLSDLKNGRMKSPGSEYLEKIVRGTGCSGTWLLTGEGEKFETRRNNAEAIAAEPTVSYLTSKLEELEQGGELAIDELPPDFGVRVAQFLVKFLERRHAGS